MIRYSLAALFAVVISTAAGASSLSFSDVWYNANSVTFTIDGNMSDYLGKKAAKNDFPYQFSLRYGGDLAPNSRPTDQGANTWSGSVFDNRNIANRGHTGSWRGLPYSWSIYDGDLSSAVATNRTVTLTLPTNYLNVTAHNPVITFLWGNGQEYTHPVALESVNAVYRAPSINTLVPQGASVTAVPLPASLPLLGAVMLGGYGLARLRRRKAA